MKWSLHTTLMEIIATGDLKPARIARETALVKEKKHTRSTCL